MQRNIKAGRPSGMVEIKVIDNAAGLVDSLPVIRQAFNTVAVESEFDTGKLSCSLCIYHNG